MRRALTLLSLVVLVGTPRVAWAQTVDAHRFVFDYGPLSQNGVPTADVAAIAAAKVEFVVASTNEGIVGSVQRQLHASGVKVVGYVDTGYAGAVRSSTTNLANVEQLTRMEFAAGVDGVFYDNTSDMYQDSAFNYYSTLYALCKSIKPDSIVIINPGIANMAERSMQCGDIICMEHNWKGIVNIPWRGKYGPSRFLGVSSNDSGNGIAYPMGYPMLIESRGC
jgi:hypothetical protein